MVESWGKPKPYRLSKHDIELGMNAEPWVVVGGVLGGGEFGMSIWRNIEA